MDESLKRILLDLPDCGAFKLGAFHLKIHEKNVSAAPLSPVYVNLRSVRSHPRLLKRIALVLEKEIKRLGLQFDLIADVPTASTPLVTALSLLNDWPMVSPRMETKSYGTGDTIDGGYKAGQTVLLIDDLITDGDSKLQAIKVLEEKGLVVKDVLVFLDRLQGGRKELKSANYRLHSVTTLRELINVLFAAGRITADAEEIVRMYLGGNIKRGWEWNEVDGIWNKIIPDRVDQTRV